VRGRESTFVPRINGNGAGSHVRWHSHLLFLEETTLARSLTCTVRGSDRFARFADPSFRHPDRSKSRSAFQRGSRRCSAGNPRNVALICVFIRIYKPRARYIPRAGFSGLESARETSRNDSAADLSSTVRVSRCPPDLTSRNTRTFARYSRGGWSPDFAGEDEAAARNDAQR